MKTPYKEKKLAKSSKSKKKKIILSVTIAMFAIPTLTMCIALCAFAIWSQTVNLNEDLLPTASAKPTFYDCEGTELDFDQDDFVNPSEIPTHLKNAFVALEDKRFYKHKGYDIVRIAGALLHNLKSKSLKEGASTITQQLVKNTHLTHERTLKRKLKEIAIATKLEKRYSKDEILAMYLSVIYFGNGAYGVKKATKLYFGKDIESLTLNECAMLAGIVKNPKKYAPLKENGDSKQRRDLVLKVMKDENYITESEYLTELNKEILADKNIDNDSKDIYECYISNAIDEVCNTLDITKYQLSNSGLKIYTNLNLSIQKALYDESNNNTNFENENVECVSVVLDNKNCAVLGYHSSLPYQVYRQAGSVLKPLAVYAPAMNENIISLATPIVDEKVDFNGYSPKNYGNKYYGETTVREGIKKSMNSVALQVFNYITIPKSVEYLNSFGISVAENDKNYSLALGSVTTSPIQIANAYMSIANGGQHEKAHFVKYICENDRKVYSSPTFAKNQLLKRSTSSLITSALVDTVKDGTAKTLSALDFEVASKTGSVQKTDDTNSDAWNVSYNDDFTVTVWHGNDIGMTEKGGGHPTRHSLKIWKNLQENFALAPTITKPDIATQNIDTFATSLNRTVTLASQNTPLEYQKCEVFAKDSIPNSISSCFEEIVLQPAFSFEFLDNKISISFNTMPIYSYRIYRTDIISHKLIKEIDGKDCTDVVSIIDTQLLPFGSVEYQIECYITSNPNIKISSTKQIFVDDIFKLQSN